MMGSELLSIIQEPLQKLRLSLCLHGLIHTKNQKKMIPPHIQVRCVPHTPGETHRSVQKT